MTFASLFAGIGGFDLALERLGHKCVYANDINKYSKIIYDKHFTVKQTCQDITTVDAVELPDFDLLCGGFPCQAFSIAGKRKGFEDTRGTLFFEIARIAKAKRPKIIFLENVKGLLSHDGGRTFATILLAIDELGYDVQWQVLNSKNFGVPQNRERVFIIGHLRGTPRPKVFPIGENNSEDLVLPTITTRITADSNGTYVSKGQTHQKIIGGLQAHQSPRSDGISPTLTSAMGMGGGQTPVLLEPTIRRLTPRECERLQGFPDGWTEGISDTQRYKCLGNAVTVNVIYEIARRF